MFNPSSKCTKMYMTPNGIVDLGKDYRLKSLVKFVGTQDIAMCQSVTCSDYFSIAKEKKVALQQRSLEWDGYLEPWSNWASQIEGQPGILCLLMRCNIKHLAINAHSKYNKYFSSNFEFIGNTRVKGEIKWYHEATRNPECGTFHKINGLTF